MLTKIMKNYYEKKLADPINDIKIYFGVIFNKSQEINTIFNSVDHPMSFVKLAIAQMPHNVR